MGGQASKDRPDCSLPAERLARELLGARLVRVLADGTRLAGVIVETEAYVGVEDAASHAFGGRRTDRNKSMYGPGGIAYVYFTYGMHHCMNVVCGREGEPEAVLLRALEPTEGLEVMRSLRGSAAKRATDLCSGPGKLCRAMAIDRALDGVGLLGGGPMILEAGERVRGSRVERTARIGIGDKGVWTSEPLRFVVKGSAHASR